MLKKLATVLAASAFAITLAAPIASACPNMDKAKQETAEKDAKDTKQDKKVAKKTTKKAKQAPKTVAKKTTK